MNMEAKITFDINEIMVLLKMCKAWKAFENDPKMKDHPLTKIVSEPFQEIEKKLKPAANYLLKELADKIKNS